MPRRWRLVLFSLSGVLIILLGIAATQLPAIGAGGLLYPVRRRDVGPTPATCQNTTFPGDAVTLKGWQCAATGARRGTLVYLHGIADNRSSARGVIERFGARGFDVVAFDARAHGESDGDVCTYGVREKRDLARVLDSVAPGPIVLMGASLGAAIALQTASESGELQTRGRPVKTVVAADVFSDLRTVATERAPFFFTSSSIARAFQLAEERGQFHVDEASPVEAAKHIRVPVLLIHGTADDATPPDHSRRVFAALAGPKRLILVPGARHGQSLQPTVWTEIEHWIDAVLGS